MFVRRLSERIVGIKNEVDNCVACAETSPAIPFDVPQFTIWRSWLRHNFCFVATRMNKLSYGTTQRVYIHRACKNAGDEQRQNYRCHINKSQQDQPCLSCLVHFDLSQKHS